MCVCALTQSHIWSMQQLSISIATCEVQTLRKKVEKDASSAASGKTKKKKKDREVAGKNGAGKNGAKKSRAQLSAQLLGCGHDVSVIV